MSCCVGFMLVVLCFLMCALRSFCCVVLRCVVECSVGLDVVALRCMLMCCVVLYCVSVGSNCVVLCEQSVVFDCVAL